MKILTARWKRWTVGIVGSAVLLVGGYWVARHYVWPKIKAIRIERMNKVARDFLAQGDDANALLTARKILQASKDNVEAWRIAVSAAKIHETSAVVYYQENLARLEPTKANYLELIRMALRYEVYGYALEAIKNVASSASDDPEFHALAAQTYLRIVPPRPVAAKFHLLTLTQLKPSDRVAQLDLAQIELAADPGRKDMALRARVRALADDPTLRVRALTLLLRESIAAKLRVETTELVNRLQTIPDLGVNERLLLLEGTLLIGAAPGNVLEQLQTEAAQKPQDVVRILDFLGRTGQERKAVDWFAKLPDETKKDEDVRRTVAEILFTLRDWPALEAHLKSGVWPVREFLRQALLAYAYRAQGRGAEFSETWKTAVIAASSDRWKAQALLFRVEAWKWDSERFDVVAKLFLLMPGNKPLRDALIAWERKQEHTVNLNRIFARIVETEPLNGLAQNNLAYTSLLLDSNIARAGIMADELVAAHPESPYYATTQAFALYKQGNAAAALAKLESLNAAELSEPERMLYHAVFLARMGETGRATELLKGINLKADGPHILLPEERRLGENALLEIARLERAQGDTKRLTVIKQNQGSAGGAGGWLLFVSPETRAGASVDMQLSDSLYASSDWNGLQATLRAADWKGDDYLRFALLAYVKRMRNDLGGSRDSWTQALTSANRNAVRVQNLQNLAGQWNWPQEQLEALNIIFERSPTDRMLLGELVKQYRDAKRTADLMRVLTTYVSAAGETTDEAAQLAYYSLLAEANVTRAQVIAKSAFAGEPDDALRRLVYVFSLWKQKRADEAIITLNELKPGANSDIVPAALVRAAILADLGQNDDARTSLALFNAKTALPEEVELAAKVAAQLKKQAEAAKTGKP